MYQVELYGRVRRAVHIEGMSIREAARVFGLHRDTVRKTLKYSVPPGYRREGPPCRPKLDPYKGVIDQILEHDQTVPKKQRHTAKRIYERLREEHGFPGKSRSSKTTCRSAVVGPERCSYRCPILRDMPSVTLGKLGWLSVEWSAKRTTSPWSCLTAMRAM